LGINSNSTLIYGEKDTILIDVVGGEEATRAGLKIISTALKTLH
jgi:hypothetical protein